MNSSPLQGSTRESYASAGEPAIPPPTMGKKVAGSLQEPNAPTIGVPSTLVPPSASHTAHHRRLSTILETKKLPRGGDPPPRAGYQPRVFKNQASIKGWILTPRKKVGMRPIKVGGKAQQAGGGPEMSHPREALDR